jgi:outer membrane immunogenic protein
MRKLLLGSVAFIALNMGSSALAADMAVKAPVYRAPLPVAVFSWTGFYIGANAGYAWGRDAVSTSVFAPFNTDAAGIMDTAALRAAGSRNFYPSGFTGGIQGGWNYQVGNAVFGLEFDFNSFRLRGSNSGTFTFPSTLPGGPIGPPTAFFSTIHSVSTDWLFTARPRLGWARDHWLIYITGGLAVTRESFNQTVFLLAPFVSTALTTTTRAGWTIGGGLEYALDYNWSIKAEYLYVDFGTASVVGTTLPAGGGISFIPSTHLTASIARVGLNYRFDGPVVARY